jgi:formylmethanofuran dehydrogenase subunit C
MQLTDVAPIKLTLKTAPTVPLEAEKISPDVLATLSNAQIKSLPVFHGKRAMQLGDFFEVEGEASERIELRGDCGRVKWIGRGMTRGRIDCVGNIGMHAGAFMRGGELHVEGNASDWLGAELAGGLIHVRGNAGGQIGAAYRGNLTGMRDGMILVRGNAGLEVGMRMKRGIIAIGGKVRDFAGIQMKGGTLVLLGGSEVRLGAWMTRGTIITTQAPRLLPTFLLACRYEPNFVGLYARHLAAHGFHLPAAAHEGSYLRYTGDSSVPGKGEILVWQAGMSPT